MWCALDSVTRGIIAWHYSEALCSHLAGLKTALVERDDFSSGTSSRSTKLIHGGVLLMQKAIMGLDFELGTQNSAKVSFDNFRSGIRAKNPG